MNNNTFVQLLMDIGKKKKNKTKFKSKRIKRNYLLARKRCYERIRIIAKKRETSKYSTRIIYDFNERFLHTLRARKQKQKPRRYCAQ